jgi:hypothetical protein
MPDPGFGRFVAEHHAFVVPTLTVRKSVTGTPIVYTSSKNEERLSYDLPYRLRIRTRERL